MDPQLLPPLTALNPSTFATTSILRATIDASRSLAELKGVVAVMPNQGILISTLGLQEAKDSSAIENIVTTHDELFKTAAFPNASLSPAAKEVQHYRRALMAGFEHVKHTRLLTINHILDVQAELEQNNAGFRKLPGTSLQDSTGRVVYKPPQDPLHVLDLMRDLESFMNDEHRLDVDPLVKMAIIHHQFESIHPFYDGNGRTGRIINALYLALQDLLDIPVLYLSREIVRTKPEYYRLLQSVRDDGDWEGWTLYMLGAVERSAAQCIATVDAIRTAMLDYKHRIRSSHRFYSQDLINTLFRHPYTKIEFVVNDLQVSRLTATRYLDVLSREGFLTKARLGRSNYFVNTALAEILVRTEGAA